VKLLGASIIIISSTGIGISIGQAHEKMTNELKELLLASNIIKGQLRYAVTELTEIMEQCGEKTEGVISDFINQIAARLQGQQTRVFSDIWLEALSYLQENSHLTTDHIHMVGELGCLLGYMDVSSQLANIEIWENNLTYEYEKQRERAQHINKVSGTLGILGGILIVILII
jgi:stage III sporulation protein AB